MLRQYLYISTAKSLPRQEVDSILSKSVRNNSLNDVTGLLLYNGRNFMQLLEGGEAELMAAMMRINNDSRHTGVTMLEQRMAERRACPDWAMNRVAIADNVERRRDSIDSDLPKMLDPDLRRVLMNFALLN